MQSGARTAPFVRYSTTRTASHASRIVVSEKFDERRRWDEVAAPDPYERHRKFIELGHVVSLRATDTEHRGGGLDSGRETERSYRVEAPRLALLAAALSLGLVAVG